MRKRDDKASARLPVPAVRATRGGSLVKFDPQKTRMQVAGLAGAIKQAKVMRDWAMGGKAIEALIALQGAFVSWWDTVVTPGEKNRGGRELVPERGLVSADDAKAQTGISKQQVSRWRERLKDPDAYRLALRKRVADCSDGQRPDGRSDR